jgi:hypothetical protein
MSLQTQKLQLIHTIIRKDVLTNLEIKKICWALDIKLNGVYMKDQITKRNLKDGNYVFNLQNHNQGGSHWVAFVKSGKEVFYSDSFGEDVPQNELDLFKLQNDKIHMNKREIQDVSSNACGWFAIGFLLFMNRGKGKLKSRFNKYIKQFTQINLKENDKIIKDIILNSM